MGSRVSSVKTQGVFNKRNCRQCKDRMNLNNFPIVSYDCTHRPNLCVVCLQDHIYAHIDTQPCCEMPCSHPKCDQNLSIVRMAHLPYSKDLIDEYIAAVTARPSPPAETDTATATAAAAAATTTTTTIPKQQPASVQTSAPEPEPAPSS